MKDFGVDNINVTKSGEEPEYNVVAAAWNVIQTEFECCGTDGYKDWTNTTIMGDDSKFNQYLDVRFLVLAYKALISPLKQVSHLV